MNTFPDTLPETDKNIIFGHGDMTAGELRKSDRRRHRWGLLVPTLRKQSREYHEGILRELPGATNESVSHVQKHLRVYCGAAAGQSFKLFLPGEKPYRLKPEFSFSDLHAIVAINEIKDAENKLVPRADWLLRFVNSYNSATHLLGVETNFGPAQDHVVNIKAFDTDTGNAYAPTDYNLEGQAQLIETVGMTFSNLSFAMATGADGFTCSQL